MYNDRDMDGIEDKYDSSFNTPEEVLVIRGIKRPVYVEADMERLKKLVQTDIPFCIRKTDDDKYEVICDKSNVDKVKQAMQLPPQRKAR